MAKYNDIDMNRWKDYSHINIESLWIIDKRDNTGVHNASYHGNFVPQIPRQLFERYTKKGDWILDPFMGSGTSLIEAQRMDRNSIGIEIKADVAREAKKRISAEDKNSCRTHVFTGDSGSINIENLLNGIGIKQFQFLIMHPPYWDIINFSDDPNDLSNSKNLEEFLFRFGKIIDNTTCFLEKERYCSVIIGDKYSKGQVVPLGFYCMNLFLEKGFILKAILVKNFGETKGKANQQAIWRYRALANDFYVFKHEYIFIFKKVR